jgi:hypothetical protein
MAVMVDIVTTIPFKILSPICVRYGARETYPIPQALRQQLEFYRNNCAVDSTAGRKTGGDL